MEQFFSKYGAELGDEIAMKIIHKHFHCMLEKFEQNDEEYLHYMRKLSEMLQDYLQLKTPTPPHMMM